MRSLILAAVLIFSVWCAPKGDSVSGLSSGAYMATQYQFANAQSIVGVAIFAGGPYYCAMGQVGFALTACMADPFLIDLSLLENDAKNFATGGSIDPLSALASHNVFVFSGTNDRTVYPGVVQKLVTMYQDLGVKNIVANFTTNAGHSFPTVNFGTSCGSTQSPYITNCGFDGAGNALQTIYGRLKNPVSPISANLRTMSISSFTPGGSANSISLDDTMYYYQPSNCKGNCSVHVAFAGCSMTFSDIGAAFPTNAGYNRWAEANDIVVLYPFTIKSFFMPTNPQGCWDWWGFLSSDYAQKTGAQIKTIKNLIAHFKSSL